MIQGETTSLLTNGRYFESRPAGISGANGNGLHSRLPWRRERRSGFFM